MGARANELLAAPPQIEKVEVLASTTLKGLSAMFQITTSKSEETKIIRRTKMTMKEREMKISPTYPPVLVATREPRSALRARMQRLGLAFLASALVMVSAR